MIAYDPTPIANLDEALSEKIWWQGRQWIVTADGLESRNGRYVIEKDRLLQDADTYGWVAHVGKKSWVDTDDFATAYLVAVALHGLHLTKAQRALVMKGYAAAVVSHAKANLHHEMFPATPTTGNKLESVNLTELDRGCKAVDAEYRRRREAAKVEAAP
jgi:hypothetical protein